MIHKQNRTLTGKLTGKIYSIPVSANVKHINIAMMITSKKRLSCGVESHLQESNRLGLTTRRVSDYSGQDAGKCINA